MFVQRRGPILEDPTGCWGGTFTPEICCSPWYGPRGHPGCWDGWVTFDACCTLYQTSDRLSRYANVKGSKALPSVAP